jgi:hypothetical protein
MQISLNGEPVAEGAIPELTEWQPAELACLPPEGTMLTLAVGDTQLTPFLRPGDASWRWAWNPQNGVGLYTLRLAARGPGGSEHACTLRVRVLPRKIDQDAYLALLDDIRRAARALAYSVGALEEAAQPVQDEGQASPLETTLALIEGGVARLEQALGPIARRPREFLRAETTRRALGDADAIEPATMAELPRLPTSPAPAEALPELQRLLRPEGGVLPPELPVTSQRPSYDNHENQLLKHLLGRLAARLRACLYQLEGERERLARNHGYLAAERGRLAAIDQLRERAASCAQRLRALQALPFLAAVGPPRQPRSPSPAMQRDPRYRQVYRLWQELRRQPRLSPSSQQLALPIHELPRLYEIWCALRVAEELLALPGGQLVTQGLLAPTDDEAGPTLALPEQAPLLELCFGAATLCLRYQPRYPPAQGPTNSERGTAGEGLVSLDRHTRVPDLALELCTGDELAVWIFDAKYRLDAGGGAPQQALDDAYAYLGSIGRADGARAVRAAYLLYPGRGEPERYASGVGALPLLPGSDGRLGALLAELLPAPAPKGGGNTAASKEDQCERL